MSPMSNFRYVDFYDVPRTIVLRFQDRWFRLQSAFNDELDEYEREYSIYPLPDSFEPVQSGSPWKFLEELELNCIAKVPVNSVQFDRTKRRNSKRPSCCKRYSARTLVMPLGTPKCRESTTKLIQKNSKIVLLGASLYIQRLTAIAFSQFRTALN